ncbi:hypothetical protein CJ739_1369 [Mariniflexile rhizosphaerae]|uniref:hypothetical protein n=1 Tax=unclassified Mariniflexile TaxID=2643887 RepID=UPI000CB5B4C7|nr:hypothetical protein [Mariniflexile sp. TRM1-10]AXP80458.1 hypothetical protein CJ739_1369 [Mariniflexile sp. TRM1-10]PLB20516.1 MAG: DUF4065 domain containing protein [Flavobacteriaceae bacterium FS1-H7996/R]
MDIQIDIFKHIVFELKEWYKEYHGIADAQFNEENDFSILKLIKLQFFVSAINSEKNTILLDNYEFFAMPYGPVETTTYAYVRNNNDLINFEISNFKIKFDSNRLLPNIDEDLLVEVKNSIHILKQKEPRLIVADAGTLVDLSHKWNCWKKNYAIARAQSKYSSVIPDNEIINDIKIINIDLA